MPEPFPNVGIQTDFTGPAENPLSEAGSWATYGAPPERYPLRKSTTSALPTFEFNVNGMYWTRAVFQSPCEVWGCISGGGLGAALEGWRLAFWHNSPYSAAGYLAGFGGGIGKDFFLRRYDGGSYGNFSGIGGLGGQPYPDYLGLRIGASEVEIWRGDNPGPVWTMVDSAADTTYRGVFYAAIELEEQGGIDELGWGCFGVGIKNRQHIYRWVRAQKGVPA